MNWLPSLVALSALAVGCMARAPEPWLAQSAAFDPRQAEEVKPVWPVRASQLAAAMNTLKNESAVRLSSGDVRGLLGTDITPPNGKSLFLLRAIDLDGKTIPLRVYVAGDAAHTAAGLYETCFFIPPSPRRQPVVVALTGMPRTVTMSYSCDG